MISGRLPAHIWAVQEIVDQLLATKAFRLAEIRNSMVEKAAQDSSEAVPLPGGSGLPKVLTALH